MEGSWIGCVAKERRSTNERFLLAFMRGRVNLFGQHGVAQPDLIKQTPRNTNVGWSVGLALVSSISATIIRASREGSFE